MVATIPGFDAHLLRYDSFLFEQPAAIWTSVPGSSAQLRYYSLTVLREVLHATVADPPPELAPI